jgi:hypothetical protein
VRATAPLPPFLVPQQSESEPETVHAPARATFLQPSFDQQDEAEEEPEEEAEAEGSDEDHQSLARLMQRFESGLGRKQQALEAAPPPVQHEPEPEAPQLPQERVGHRLRSAISDLGKISAPGR